MTVKSEIRKAVIQNRSALDKDYVDVKSKEICDKIGNLPHFITSNNILIYISMKNEVDLKYLFDNFKETKNFYCPVCISKETMTYVRLENYMNLVESSRFRGLYEPSFDNASVETINKEKLDLAIVPGVAFDIHKNRLGYGAGYYDRFFANLKYDPIKIGVCYSLQVVDFIPCCETDVKMNYLLTENQFL